MNGIHLKEKTFAGRIAEALRGAAAGLTASRTGRAGLAALAWLGGAFLLAGRHLLR